MYVIGIGLKLEEKFRVYMIENELDVVQEYVGQHEVVNNTLWDCIMQDCYVWDKIRRQENDWCMEDLEIYENWPVVDCNQVV